MNDFSPIRQRYHCCIQKTASQWIRTILSREVILEHSRQDPFDPYSDLITFDKTRSLFKSPSYKAFPLDHFITPLYIHRDTFVNLEKADNYKAFFVYRDPRDIIVSWYFSTRNSHPRDGFIDGHQDALQPLTIEDGIRYSIMALEDFGLFDAMESWISTSNSKREKLVKFEDITGPNRLSHWMELFTFLEIPVSTAEVSTLLDIYNFSCFSEGRLPGEEDAYSHMRKGISGDWRNYFSEEISKLYKKVTADLGERAGYEP